MKAYIALGSNLGDRQAYLEQALKALREQPVIPGRELKGLRALVTGSTSGIGKAIALELAGAGADVMVHGRRSRDAADAVAAEARDQDVRAEVLMADLADPAACEELVRA